MMHLFGKNTIFNGLPNVSSSPNKHYKLAIIDLQILRLQLYSALAAAKYLYNMYNNELDVIFTTMGGRVDPTLFSRWLV